jgi:chromosome segregation ATPase
MRNGDEHWFGGMWAPSAASDAVWTAWKARQESRAKLALDTRQMLIATRDTSELTKQEIQIRSLRRCLKDLEDDARSNSDAKVALAKAQMRSEKLKEEIELLSASVTNLAAEHAEQRDLRVAQEAAARELKSRLEDETESRARFERKVSDLAAECEEHRCRGEELRAHRQAVERRADEARARCVEVERAGEATASGLRVELENQKIEYARTASKLAETTSLLDAERADKASTMAALDTARKQNSAMDADNAILRKKVAVAEECVGEFDAKLVALEAKLIAADAMCATLRKEADAANKKAETFEKDLIRARGEAERARSAVKEGADEWKEAMAACVAAERDAAGRASRRVFRA